MKKTTKRMIAMAIIEGILTASTTVALGYFITKGVNIATNEKADKKKYAEAEIIRGVRDFIKDTDHTINKIELVDFILQKYNVTIEQALDLAILFDEYNK